MSKATKKVTKWFFLAAGAVLIIALGVRFTRNNIEIDKGKIDLVKMSWPISDLSGIRCGPGQDRPIAVMLSSDREARPLSAIAEADWVFEMPVTDGGVTRMMAVFQCAQPVEIGSVRSARLDFMPLVQGLGAVYAHWGGEKEALAQLDKKILDNLDALRYEGTIYYRKNGTRPPHNGFTSYKLLKQEMDKRGYSLTKSAVKYSHEAGEKSPAAEGAEPPELYKDQFAVKWSFDAASRSYERWRGGSWEVDRQTKQPVKASNVVLMYADWSPVSKDYIRVQTVGQGRIVVYQQGRTIEGAWEKKGDKEKLFFYDKQRQEIKFVPGTTWVEILI